MILTLSLQGAAVYACALALAHLAPPSARRPVLRAALVAVAALPLAAALPPAPLPAPGPVVAAALSALPALQEPAVGAAHAVATAASGPAPATVLAVGWALGAAVAFARLAADLRAVRRLRAGARALADGVATSDAVAVPVAVGVAAPVVLLPAAAADWPADQRALAVAHERAHVRAHDNAWLLAARVLACLHWPDPLAHAAVGALRQAQEHRADDEVLAGGADPVSYADALLAVARGRGPALGSAMARPSGLEQRLRAVLDPRTAPRAPWLRPALLAAAALAVSVVAPPSLPAVAGTAVEAPADLSTRLEAEAERLTAAYGPDGVALVVLDARTGAEVARAERGGLLDRPVPPGSLLKPFAVVAARERGAPADARFADEDLGDILATSSNPGASAVAAWAGPAALRDVWGRVGLPAPDEAGTEALALGAVPTAPLDVARAWVALAGHGGVSPAHASEVRGLLRGVVERDCGTGRAAAVPGVRVAGKTGTARLHDADGAERPGAYLSSFVGLIPAQDPDYVVLVAVEAPRTEDYWGGAVAAPAFARIAAGLR